MLVLLGIRAANVYPKKAKARLEWAGLAHCEHVSSRRQVSCLFTNLVISNIDTCRFPPNTAFSWSSALIIRRSFASCRPFFLIYAQSFFTTSVRGSGLSPTTSAKTGDGCIAFMNAALGLRLVPVDFFEALFFAIFFAAIRFESPPLQGTLIGFVPKAGERLLPEPQREKQSLERFFTRGSGISWHPTCCGRAFPD